MATNHRFRVRRAALPNPTVREVVVVIPAHDEQERPLRRFALLAHAWLWV
jgi:hypothetical protein